MSKKMMLLALAVVSAAFFALPAIASAQEIHLEPGNGETFTISGVGGEFRVQEESPFTCEGLEGGGKIDEDSSTTGSVTMFFTGCHVSSFFTTPCHSEGSPVNNTISFSGTLHLITISSEAPGFLFTRDKTGLVCNTINPTVMAGSLIGTITSPKCGKSSTSVSLSFTATGRPRIT